MTNRARPIVACRCSMPSPALYRPVSSAPLTCSSTRSIGRRPRDTRPLTSEILVGMTLSPRSAKNRRPALAPPNAVTVTLGWSAAKASLKVSAKNTHGMAGCAPPAHRAGRVRKHRFRCRLSPPDSLAGTDQPGKIERFGRYGDRSFHAPLRAAISRNARTSPNRAVASRERAANPGSRGAPPPMRGKNSRACHPVT